MKEKSPYKLDSEEIPIGRMKWYSYGHAYMLLTPVAV